MSREQDVEEVRKPPTAKAFPQLSVVVPPKRGPIPHPPDPLSPVSPPSAIRKRRPQALHLAPKTPGTTSHGLDAFCETLGSMKRAVSGASTPHGQSGAVGAGSPQTSAGTACVPSHEDVAQALAAALAPHTTEVEGELQVHGVDEVVELCKLGQGASGVVEKHRHRHTGKEVAIKKVKAGDIAETQRKAILLELRTFAKCNNPHIVQFYGAFLHEDVIHIALEYMNAGALSDVLEVRNTVPERQLSNITWQVLDGLEYLHGSMRVIHRDIKPSNLLLSIAGAVKITDFGVSGELQDELAQSNNKHTWVGTIYYMSPERVLGNPYKYDSDLWSLGLTMLECLTGCYPYTDTGKSCKKQLSFWELMKRIVENEAPKLPPGDEFSAGLRVFLDAVLQKDQKNRQSASAMKAHNWLRSADKQDFQVSVAEWIGASQDLQGNGLARKPERGAAAAPSLAGVHGQTPADPGMADPASPGAPMMRSSVRGAGNLFKQSEVAGVAKGHDLALSMSSSVRNGSNPFAQSGSNPFAQSGSGATPFAQGGANPFVQAMKGGGNPFLEQARQGSADLLLDGAPTAPALPPLQDLLESSPRLEAMARKVGELSDADLQKWEGDIKRIALAFSSDEVKGAEGADSSANGPLPGRIDTTGPGLYISDAASAKDAESLQLLGVSAVLNCGAPTIRYSADLELLVVACEDTEGYPLLVRHLDACLDFFERCEAKGCGLLVHCVMGLNRSASLVVALLMLKRDTMLLDAVRRVWDSRGRLPILTNSSFRRQLVQLAHLAGKLG